MRYLWQMLFAGIISWALMPSPVTVPVPAPTVSRSPVTVASVRSGSLVPRFNFPAASRSDRFARRGLDLRRARNGWKRFGPLIRTVAKREGIDPHVLGAYVWVESGFNPKQDYRKGTMRAVGLGSVQAQYHTRFTVRQLQDPTLNLTLTAREFRAKWRKHDMAGTVMDVWYPAWRRKKGKDIPVVGRPEVYIQAIANRYDALHRLDHLR